MQFICKPECLNFSGRQNGGGGSSLYYKYQAKQTRNRLVDQRNRLQAMLEQIIKQEENAKPAQPRFTEDGFYEYATQWKKRKDKQVTEKIIEKAKAITKKQQQSLMVQRSSTINGWAAICKDQHKGPISGWKQHFQKYIRQKAQTKLPNSENQIYFKPKINKKSLDMMHRSKQPIQSRLIEYGKQVQIKKQEIANEYYSKFHKYPQNSSHSDQNTYSKLYKEAEKINRQRARDQNQYTFKPQITKISEQMEERIKNKRQPLYCLKNSNTVVQQKANEVAKISTQRKTQNFKEFLKRNQVLIQMRKNLSKVKENSAMQQQKSQEKKCTFSPHLNLNSKKIFKTRQQYQNQYLIERIQQAVLTETRIESTQRQRIQSNVTDKSEGISQSFDQKQKEMRPLSTSPRSHSNPTLTYMKKQKNMNQCEISGRDQIIDELNQQDSIQKMRESEWESQLKDVEDQLQKMMERAIKH